MKGCKLIGKIVKVDGECSAGHHVGEKFDLTLFSEEANKTLRTPSMCGFFYDAIFPYLVTLQFGGAFPWEKEKDKFLSGCPDNNKVTVEIRRVKKK
ncbi:MAG: TIGR04076 family protein [Candidatus Bathycorpusculaceae bacterium]